VARCGRSDFLKGLRVGHDEAGRGLQTVQGLAQLVFLDHQTTGVVVEQVANGLNLGQDQTPFGSFLVNRDHQQNQFAGADQVANDGRTVDEFRRCQVEQGLAEAVESKALRGGGFDMADFLSRQPGEPRRFGSCHIHLVEHHQDRHPPTLELGEDFRFKPTPSAGLGHQHPQISSIEHLPGFANTQPSQLAFVVHTGRVNEHHRTQGEELHGFFDRVGGGAGDGGHNRDLLAGDGVEQAGLAHVAPAEEGDVKAQGFRGRRGMTARPQRCGVVPGLKRGGVHTKTSRWLARTSATRRREISPTDGSRVASSRSTSCSPARRVSGRA